MKFKPYKDVIGITMCLGHTFQKGQSQAMLFCEKADECQRNLILREHQVEVTDALCLRCCVVGEYDQFLGEEL